MRSPPIFKAYIVNPQDFPSKLASSLKIQPGNSINQPFSNINSKKDPAMPIAPYLVEFE